MTPDEIRPLVDQLNKYANCYSSNPGVTMRMNEAIATAASDQLGEITKPWWQSRAVWGAIIVVLAQLARLVEVDLPVESMTDAALSLATLAGAVMAWWGRVRAERPISLTRVLPGVRGQ